MELVNALHDIDWQNREPESSTFTNLSEEVEYENYLKKHWRLSISYISVMAVTISIGVVGNFLVIASVLMHPKLRTKANVFIVNLAIADSLVAYSVQGFNIAGVVFGGRFYAGRPLLCHAVVTGCLVSCTASLWTMCAVAINRYVCICRPKLHELMFNTWFKCIAWCIFVWFLSWSFVTPSYFETWSYHHFDTKMMTCFYNRKVYSYTLFMAIVTVNPPVVTVAICYLMIFLHVRASRLTVQQTGAVASSGDRGTGGFTKSELELAKTLFLIYVVFTICWAPYLLTTLIDYNDSFPKVVYIVVVQLAHINSSLNCIIYAVYNKDFRNGYIRVVYCWRKFDRKGNLLPKHNDNATNKKQPKSVQSITK